MSEKKITIEDIAFLITRLTCALEVFSQQVHDTNNIFVTDVLKVKRNSKEDGEIWSMLELRANLTRKYGESSERIDEILNPTPSEFDELRLKHRKFARENRKKERYVIASEQRSMSEINNGQPLKFASIDTIKILKGYIVVARRGQYCGDKIGVVDYINTGNVFPLKLHESKNHLTPGKRQFEVEAAENITAIVDTTKAKKSLTTCLILLAIKHQISFEGLVYLRLPAKD